MNLDGIRVNHGAVDQAAADMYQKVKDIDDRMNRLESELEPLRSQWIGQAQSQYTVSKAKWDMAIQEMRDLLDKSSQTVYQSNAEYAAADKRGAAQFEI
ncbi:MULTISPECIES: WXG100 family type VII secretion target [unclassified Nocardioides]|uniref:WXG100 family type VII secretion target n=1 Tax=unclassified Nocardioides TaxID=2615069 RepID=UPI001E4ABB63|nr:MULTISPECIES: WXG100 family type VII secretion target [unclassified Nocardioides]MCD4523454.1 WXG100 family type VII secretion target [Nocardioides sp. cx-173]MCD4532773.1 WXG100 family type VII secretion target [Nocardioides sp. cx-169]UGB42207.1 WXG100 family type VII secretion target [Nocardioides sp. cx-173]